MEDLLQVEIVKLEDELSKLKSAVEYIETAKISIESASKIINTISKLKEEFETLSGKAYLLIDKLDKVDFPARLEKLDSRISSVTNELGALKTNTEAINKTIYSEMKISSKNILSELSDSRNNILTRLEKQSKDIKIVHISIVITLFLITTLGILFYLNIL